VIAGFITLWVKERSGVDPAALLGTLISAR
jgi:hypothetical protein